MAKEFLTVFPFYEKTEKKDVRLFAIDNSLHGWNIYADKNGTLYAIPVAWTNGGGTGSYFGDCFHIKSLIKRGYFSGRTLTAYGRQLMEENAGFIGN